ncbi:MAG: kynurenine formamidase [Bacteriovoracaceae bacterium]|jgi:kynurenine formamidase
MTTEKIFLSHPLSNETIGYGGAKEFNSEYVRCIAEGDTCTQSSWKLSNHIGTHIDVPAHFSISGKTIDQYPASHWVYDKIDLIEIEAAEGELIQPKEWVETISQEAEILLLRTNFERYRGTEAYWARNPGLSKELGLWLRKNRPNLRTIGFDLISITSYMHRAEGKIAHRAFLSPDEEGVPLTVIEDMKLLGVPENLKTLIVSPLIVAGADGSPVTVIATT